MLEGTANALHNTGATVTNYSSFSGWGQSSADTDTVADPGLWSLDNLGTTLIALIHNGECFEWDADLTNAQTKSYNYSRCTNSIKRYVSIYSRSSLSIFWN